MKSSLIAHKCVFMTTAVLSRVLLVGPSVLAPLRGAPENEEDGDEAAAPTINKSKERIDTEKFAQQALDKAQSTLELRKLPSFPYILT